MSLERGPHSLRAYGLATFVLGGIVKENARHGDPSAGASSGEPPAPTAIFDSALDSLQSQVEDAERAFKAAAQRSAQVRYGRGMLKGMVGLAAFCALCAVAFLIFHVDAAYGVALPAGGLGAAVSVLQRMTSNRLKLDFEASGELIEIYGAVRPFVGAIFGLALFALVESGLLTVIEVQQGQELAFFGVLGFIAGFNERFAQDMLVGSAKRIDSQAGSTGGPPIPSMSDARA